MLGCKDRAVTTATEQDDDHNAAETADECPIQSRLRPIFDKKPSKSNDGADQNAMNWADAEADYRQEFPRFPIRVKKFEVFVRQPVESTGRH